VVWRRFAAAEAAVEIEALIGEAVLHIEHDGAAERVQSEQRIAGDDDAAVDGDGGIKSQLTVSP